MKKTFFVVVGAIAGYLTWLKVQQDREERELWAEVTDSFEDHPARS